MFLSLESNTKPQRPEQHLTRRPLRQKLPLHPCLPSLKLPSANYFPLLATSPELVEKLLAGGTRQALPCAGNTPGLCTAACEETQRHGACRRHRHAAHPPQNYRGDLEQPQGAAAHGQAVSVLLPDEQSWEASSRDKPGEGKGIERFSIRPFILKFPNCIRNLAATSPA